MVRSKKDDVKYTCKQCEYQTFSPKTIRVHVQNKHRGIRYPCKLCEYIATVKCSLGRHMKFIHNQAKGTKIVAKKQEGPRCED